MSAASSWENALEDAAVTPSVLIVDGLELNRRLLRGIEALVYEHLRQP